MARFARQTGVPLPMIVGPNMSTAEWYATQHVSLEWSLTEALLVTVAERVDALRFVVQSVFSGKGAKVDPPLHIPRPGEEPKKPRMLTGPEFAAMLRDEGIVK